MFFCEMCGSGDCCERIDIYGGPILCDTCYIEAKQDQEDRDTIEEIFKENQHLEDDMRGKKCWKCKYWTKYYNSNQYFCKRGYCRNKTLEDKK